LVYVSVAEVEKKLTQALNICIFAMFLAIKCCINQCKLNMNKPLSKNLQNIDMNDTLSFGECKCCWSGEKTFKGMYCNWNLLSQIEKVQ